MSRKTPSYLSRSAIGLISIASLPSFANSDCSSLDSDAAADAIYAAQTELEGLPCFDEILGEIELRSQRFNEATFTLERVVATSPDNTYARLMLGEAYLQTGQNALARAQWDYVVNSAGSESEQHSATARAHLQALDALEKSQRWNFHAELGLGYDSNYNYGVDEDTIEFQGFDIPAGDTLSAKDSVLGDITLESYFQASDRWNLLASLWNRSYTEDHHQSLITFSGAYTTSAKQYPTQVSLSVKPLFIDGAYVRTEVGTGTYTDLAALNLTFLSSIDTRLDWLSYDNSDFDRARISLAISGATMAKGATSQTYRFSLASEVPGSDSAKVFSKHSATLELPTVWNINDAQSLTLTPSMQYDQYHAPFIDGSDQQKNTTVNASLVYRHWIGNTEASGSYRYAHNASNINFFDYQRHEVRAGISHWF